MRLFSDHFVCEQEGVQVFSLLEALGDMLGHGENEG